MLINKLIHRIVYPQINLNPACFLFAKQKPQKSEAPKQTKSPGKDAGKGSGKSVDKGKKGENNVKKQQKPIQPMPVSFTNQTNSGSLYRGIVKQVQIKNKTGRAQFNDEAFKKIVNIAVPQDIKLIFECYYNYMGHHTILTNKTVDNLINKAIRLANESKDIEEQALTEILDIYNNHQYLSYYPHYDTTIKMAKFAARMNKFDQVLKILKDKMLVKLNKYAVKQIFQLATNSKDFMLLTKMIAYRFNRGLIIDATSQQLLAYIAKGIKRMESISFTNQNPQYRNLLATIKTPSVDLAVAWMVVSNKSLKAAKMLKEIKENDPNINFVAQTFRKLEQGQDKNAFRTQFKEHLQKTSYENLLE